MDTMKRTVFDLQQTKKYIVVQLNRCCWEDYDGRTIEGFPTPKVILETDDLSKCRRLLWQIATDDHKQLPPGVKSLEETYVQHKSGRIVRRYIPYKF